MSDDPPPEQISDQQETAFREARLPARARLSEKDKVRRLLSLIRKKLDAGWSYEAVRAELEKTVGFRGTRETLYNYVCQLSSRKPPARVRVPRTARAAGTPASPLPPPAPAPPSEPASDGTAPLNQKPVYNRDFIRNLGGPHARAELQRAREERELKARELKARELKEQELKGGQLPDQSASPSPSDKSSSSLIDQLNRRL